MACAPLVRSEDVVLYSYADGIRDSNFRISQSNEFENTNIYRNSLTDVSDVRK